MTITEKIFSARKRAPNAQSAFKRLAPLAGEEGFYLARQRREGMTIIFEAKGAPKAQKSSVRAYPKKLTAPLEKFGKSIPVLFHVEQKKY